MATLPADIVEAIEAIPTDFDELLAWGQGPIPSGLDERFDAVIAFALAAGAAARTELVGRLRSHSGFLLAYANRMAVLAVRTKDADRIFQGLMAIVLEEFRPDDRDTMVQLFILRHAALKLGVDSAPLLRRAAKYASPACKKRIESIARQPSRLRDLREMGYEETETADGLAFRRRRAGSP